jgi:hypothetical protein
METRELAMKRLRTVLLAMGLVVMILASRGLAQTSGAPETDPEASAKLFKSIAQVLRHPRCMNCHTVTDFPRQGD